jgi:hypothetical protein
MEVLQVAVLGAGIGMAVLLLDFAWNQIRFLTQWWGISPAIVVALGAVGGAVVISAEYWLVVTLLAALS